MTRRRAPGGETPEAPKPVAVHGCVPLYAAPSVVELEPQTLRGVVAGRGPVRISSPAQLPELGDTALMPFGLAPASPPMLRLPALPIGGEPRVSAGSAGPDAPSSPLAVPAHAERPAVVARHWAGAVSGTIPLGIERAPRRTPASAPPAAAPAPRAADRGPGPAAARPNANRPAVVAAPVPAAPPPPAASAPAAAPALAAAHAAAAPIPARFARAGTENLFRREALAALHGVASPNEEMKLPRPSAYGWAVLLMIASLALFIFGGAALAKVEVTVVAPGALRDPSGLRAVAATLPGAVAEVLVRAGDEVQEGQVLARLEVAQLEADLKQREQELAVLEKENAVADRADAKYTEQMARALRQRSSVLHRRGSLNRALKGQRKDQLERMRESVREGVASLNQELGTREALQEALEAEQLLRSALADVDIQLAEIQDRLENRALGRRTEQARVVAAVAAARALIEESTIVAPAAGRVESLLISPGSVITAGQLLAQIVPGGALRSIVAFLPSRETAFVSVGSLARVEVESLPVNEFGQARARVTRISTDIAKPEELIAQFGEGSPGSFVRVELELLPGKETEQMAPHLRSGELLKVRLHRRERRIISLMFQFARTWLGQ